MILIQEKEVFDGDSGIVGVMWSDKTIVADEDAARRWINEQHRYNTAYRLLPLKTTKIQEINVTKAEAISINVTETELI